MRQGQGWAIVGALVCSVLGPGSSRRRRRAASGCCPTTRLGVRTAPLLLLSRPDVQSTFAWSPARFPDAQRTINELTKRAASLRGKSARRSSPRRRAIDEAQVDWLSEELSRATS